MEHNPTVIFQLLEIPLLVMAITFATRSAVLLRKPGIELSADQIGRGMAALAVGFVIMGVGHLAMQSESLLGFDMFEFLLGPNAGRIGWFMALIVTWSFSCAGFYVILKAATNATVNNATQELRKEALYDGLTGIHNRRALEQGATQMIDKTRSSGEPLSVLLLDLDHFKNVNDTHGHAAGDRVLIEVARRTRSQLRKGELAARFGGEEFCVILPLDAEEAVVIANRIRGAISDSPIQCKNASLRVTASIGVATYGPAGTDLTSLLGRADEALYRAKTAGRDRVVAHDPQDESSGSDLLQTWTGEVRLLT